MLNRLDLRGLGSNVADRLPRPVIAGEGPTAAVRQIISDVCSGGDSVLLELTERFDGVSLEAVQVPDAELDAAVDSLRPEIRSALEIAIENVAEFHRRQRVEPHEVASPGVVIRAYTTPVGRAGVYVPGGRAEYPSTLIMTAVPARVAGVKEIIVCVPPSSETGRVAPSVLAAARLAGVDAVYAVGGAQAIAAMAYGTETIEPVDVVAGPGNVYVAIAKAEVSGDVGVAAAFAGPSEVVVVADETANPSYAAIDVILQAEHGPDGLAWLVTWDESVADAVLEAGERILETAPRADEVRSTLALGGYVAIVDDREAAVAVVDAIAPEHLELQIEGAEELAATVSNAGAIFCGHLSPASIGDYVAGPSHVLPTYGSARFASALTVGDFTKDHHTVTITAEGIGRLGPPTVVLAELEGLDAHAQSVRLRLADLRQEAAPDA